METQSSYNLRSCPGCDLEAPKEANFCSFCGKKLPKLKPPEPVVDQPVIKEIDSILTPKEAARLLKISRWKLDELRIQKKLPQDCYFIIPSNGDGNRQIVRYYTKAILSWKGGEENHVHGYIHGY